MKDKLDELIRQDYRRYLDSIQVPPSPTIQPPPIARQNFSWKQLYGSIVAACLVALFIPLSLESHKEAPILGRMLFQASQDQRAIDAGNELTLRFITDIQMQFKRSKS